MLHVHAIKTACSVSTDTETGNWENWCLKIHVDMIFVDYRHNNISVRTFR